MENKKKMIFAILLLVVSIIAILITLFVGPCTGNIETAAGGEIPMKCVWTARAVMMTAIIAACISVSQFFVKSTDAVRLAAVLLIVCSIIIIVITCNTGIGVCAAEGMKCGRMAMLVRIDMIILLIISFIELMFSGRNEKKPKYGF